MVNFAVCIFLSAFLIFQIQPIISKILLPWFGGTPAVWTSAMLFFQILLTGGYVYSNWLATRNKAEKQSIIHLVLLGISFCLIIYLWIIWPSPINPGEEWRSSHIPYPMLYIFILLSISVGLPYFILSTNNPLMQDWFARRNPHRSPYWLYALSNIGSLLGLISYPIMIEPMLTVKSQGWLWAVGYFLFVIIAVYNTLLLRQSVRTPNNNEIDADLYVGKKPKPSSQVIWIFLSSCASLLFLAVTNQITNELAVIPFLWVVPLSIYLISFILTFSSKRWYHRRTYTILLLIATGGIFFIILNNTTNFIIQIILYCFFLFVAAMTCHGELYAMRPAPVYLTHFYVMVSIGGAVGGIIVNIVAPSIFRGYWEIYLGIAFIWILLAIFSYPRTRTKFWSGILVGGIATIVTIFMIFIIYYSSSGDIFIRRNFYGVVRVKQMEIKETQQLANQLVYDATIHGFQFIEPENLKIPTSYFTEDSGIGLAILSNPRYGSGMRVGVLGLGIGTLAAYGQPGDYYRFYEINPVIVDLANGQDGLFSFLKDSQADIDIILGDARLSLENEISNGQVNLFDILVLDTFAGGSIPIHLITKEAFDIYLQNIASDGLIAANISNNYLDLKPVVWQVARLNNLNISIIYDPAEDNPAASPSLWALLTRNSKLLESPELENRADDLVDFDTNIRLWTDDYSNLIQIIK